MIVSLSMLLFVAFGVGVLVGRKLEQTRAKYVSIVRIERDRARAGSRGSDDGKDRTSSAAVVDLLVRHQF